MNLEQFRNSPTGEMVREHHGGEEYWAYVPNPLPPQFDLDKTLVNMIIKADGALGEMRGLARNVPNLGLLSHSFIHREAVLSSRIEGIHTSILELYAYEAGQLSLPGISNGSNEINLELVVNYTRALLYGLEWAKQKDRLLSLGVIRETHGLLMSGARGDETHPGEFRTIQNVIGNRGAKLQNARFIPPPAIQMRDALNEFERYLQADDIDPLLLRLAYIHYQFETIHPFEDGNGRLGRLLVPLLMVHWGLLPQPLFNLSAYLDRNRDEYCDLLLAVSREGAWRRWVEFFVQGIAEEASDAINRAQQMLDIRTEWQRKLQGQAHATGTVFAAADYVFERPILTAKHLQEHFGVSAPTARGILARLENVGIVEETTGAERNRVYVAKNILANLL